MGNGNSLINLTLDQPSPGIYYTGDVLSGQVHFQLREATGTVEEVFLSLTGEVGYTTTRTVRMQNGQIERKVDQHDIQMLSQRYLLGRPMINGRTIPSNVKTLEAGQYSYPFAIRLPENLPPTLHPEDYPFVRYQLQILIEKKWYHASDRHRYPIKIYPRVNLLHISNAQSAVKFGTKHKDTTIKGLLPRAGLVPGEETHLSLIIENPTRLALKRIDLCLIQRYDIEQCRRRLELLRFPLPEIQNNAEQHIEVNCLFVVPLGIPPSFHYVSKNTRTIVHVELHYDLKLEIKAKGFFTDFDLQVPVMIGTCLPEQTTISGGRHLNENIESPPPAYESVVQRSMP